VTPFDSSTELETGEPESCDAEVIFGGMMRVLPRFQKPL
jgi:hypothetical protein